MHCRWQIWNTPGSHLGDRAAPAAGVHGWLPALLPSGSVMLPDILQRHPWQSVAIHAEIIKPRVTVCSIFWPMNGWSWPARWSCKKALLINQKHKSRRAPKWHTSCVWESAISWRTMDGKEWWTLPSCDHVATVPMEKPGRMEWNGMENYLLTKFDRTHKEFVSISSQQI